MYYWKKLETSYFDLRKIGLVLWKMNFWLQNKNNKPFLHVQKFLFFDRINVWFMSFGQSVECPNWCWMSNICYLFNCGRVLQFGAHSRYKGALTQKRSFLVICTTFRSYFRVSWKNQNKHSTLNSSFDTVQMTWTRH